MESLEEFEKIPRVPISECIDKVVHIDDWTEETVPFIEINDNIGHIDDSTEPMSKKMSLQGLFLSQKIKKH